jgi:hypothetical protein
MESIHSGMNGLVSRPREFEAAKLRADGALYTRWAKFPFLYAETLLWSASWASELRLFPCA